jgi:hypothetical protein
MSAPLDAFIPAPQVRERFETTIRAPAALVLETAATFDLQSIGLVRAIFWLRDRVMRAAPTSRVPQGLLVETLGLGWGLLVRNPTLIVCGARCQPWLADVRFHAIPPDRFAAYAEPNQVKIAWTLEAYEVEPQLTRFAHETRVVATDDESHRRFRAYWRWARFGIIAIRLLLMPAIRRSAERAAAQR